MEIINKIIQLKKSISEAENLVEQLFTRLKTQEVNTKKKEKEILILKEEIKNNIKKIDNIIEDYNANS